MALIDIESYHAKQALQKCAAPICPIGHLSDVARCVSGWPWPGFVEEFQIWLESKQARTSLPGDLFENPQLFKSGHKSVGGAGIQSHGRRYDTLDIDVTPNRDEDNLRRLAEALNGLDCLLVTDPANTAAWVPLPPDYFTPRILLAATVWNLATRHGQLDLTFAPALGLLCSWLLFRGVLVAGGGGPKRLQ